MHKSIIVTNVILIPKVANLKRVSQCRPITLYNVVYKVISKIIANRIRSVLSKLICPTQAAFVPGLRIHDKNVLVQEIIHSFKLKKGKKGVFAIKIDLAKACNKLSCLEASRVEAESLSKVRRATLIKSGCEQGNQVICLKAWDRFCLPKSRGELGFRKTLEMNQALLAKWGWALLNEEQCLCCKVLNAITPNHGRVTKVAELLLDSGDWDIPKLRTLFDSKTICNIIKGGRPSCLGKDKWVWTKESNGQFTTKFAYLIQALERSPDCVVAPALWNKLWNSKILERHKVLWGRILSDALPIRTLLAQRMSIEEISCPLCGAGEESMEHLFLYCNFAYHLWRSSPWGVYPVFDSGACIWDWVTFIWNMKSKGVNTDKLFLYASIVVDTIWMTRNEKVHNNSSGNIKHVIDSISFCCIDYESCLFELAVVVVSHVWSPPLVGWIKINCDVKTIIVYLVITSLPNGVHNNRSIKKHFFHHRTLRMETPKELHPIPHMTTRLNYRNKAPRECLPKHESGGLWTEYSTTRLCDVPRFYYSKVCSTMKEPLHTGVAVKCLD
uniref:Reverse transcriptase zinc-binding domain-containing protein n=1 Tax=Cannabis sativa TaxID=3483 RepID=A0A803QEG3_CANSA